MKKAAAAGDDSSALQDGDTEKRRLAGVPGGRWDRIRRDRSGGRAVTKFMAGVGGAGEAAFGAGVREAEGEECLSLRRRRARERAREHAGMN